MFISETFTSIQGEGLLAGVPSDNAEACLAALRNAGYSHTTIIGRVKERSEAPQPIVLT